MINPKNPAESGPVESIAGTREDAAVKTASAEAFKIGETTAHPVSADSATGGLANEVARLETGVSFETNTASAATEAAGEEAVPDTREQSWEFSDYISDIWFGAGGDDQAHPGYTTLNAITSAGENI